MELGYEQGRVFGTDRPRQLEAHRAHAEGRTAARIGRPGLDWDLLARRSQLTDLAQRAFGKLDEETKAFIAAYAEGVNAGLGREAWTPWTPLAVFAAQHLMFGIFPTKLWRHHVAAVAGPEGLPLFRAEAAAGGSNAFVVGPGRTASGMPIVAGDPHRTFEAPNPYAQVRLSCPELDVVGFTFPGVPGVQHFAHTGGVAWAITNATADYQDVYLERLQRQGDAVTARGPHGWEPCQRTVEQIDVLDDAAVEVEILVTDRGPVVIGGPETPEAFSLRTPAWLRGDLGFQALLPLLRAQTVDDVDAALAHWVEPVNNVVVADTSGRCLHRVAGLVPRRELGLSPVRSAAEDGHGWTGWVDDLPRTEVGRDGVHVTANERGSAAYDRIGQDFAATFRADRITELLDTGGKVDVPTAEAVLADIHQNAGQALLRAIDRLDGLGGAAGHVQQTLRDWDGSMRPDDAGAALFSAVRARLVELLADHPALARLSGGSPYGDLYAAWFSLPTRLAVCLHIWLGSDRTLGIDVAVLLRQALDEVAARTPTTPWGERHRFRPIAADAEAPYDGPDLALPGDTDCVFAAAWSPGGDACVKGPVARYVWDLADRGQSRWVVPLGAGETGAHALDQLETWAAGGTLPVELSP